MKEALINLLATFGFPVRLQGTFAKDENYPAAFFTFWNDETYDGAHYDNDAVAFVWAFTINFYATDPALVNNILKQVRTLLRAHGWIINGVGSDTPVDEPTHTGRSIDALYLQKNVED